MKSKLIRLSKQHRPVTIRNQIGKYTPANALKSQTNWGRILNIRIIWATIAVRFFFFFLFGSLYIVCTQASSQRSHTSHTETNQTNERHTEKTTVENSYDKSARFHHVRIVWTMSSKNLSKAQLQFSELSLKNNVRVNFVQISVPHLFLFTHPNQANKQK